MLDNHLVDNYHDLKNKVENACRKVISDEYLFSKQRTTPVEEFLTLKENKLKALLLIAQIKDVLTEIEKGLEQ